MVSGNRLVAVFTPVATLAAPRDAGNPARPLPQSLSWRYILLFPHVTCQLLHTAPGNSRKFATGCNGGAQAR